MTPQLALRVAICGSVALALFAVIFFRLWFLQVLSGDQYLAQATVNRVRDIAILPERGSILDQRASSSPTAARRWRFRSHRRTCLPRRTRGGCSTATSRACCGMSDKRSRCVVSGPGGGGHADDADRL